jgi:hypothetical protein
MFGGIIMVYLTGNAFCVRKSWHLCFGDVMLLCHSVSRAFSSSVWLPSSSLGNAEVRWSEESAAAGCGERGTDNVLGWKVNVFLTDQFRPAK